MSIHLPRALEDLKRKLVVLSTLVEENFTKAVKSAEEGDAALAREVIAADNDIDQMEIDVEENALQILALYNPVAVDLRYIVASIKLNSDLERIGDMAVQIARRTKHLAEKQPIKREERFSFSEMFEYARRMLRNSLNALFTLDINLAMQVCASDRTLDAMTDAVVDKVRKAARSNPDAIGALIDYLFIARALERIGDHATNIAEDVIYMVEARIVRHHVE